MAIGVPPCAFAGCDDPFNGPLNTNNFKNGGWEASPAGKALAGILERDSFASYDELMTYVSLGRLFQEHGLGANSITPDTDVGDNNKLEMLHILLRENAKEEIRKRIFERYSETIEEKISNFFKQHGSKALDLTQYRRLISELGRRSSEDPIQLATAGPDGRHRAQRIVAQNFFSNRPTANSAVKFLSYDTHSRMNVHARLVQVEIIEENLSKLLQTSGLNKAHIIELLGIEPSGRSYLQSWAFSKLAMLAEALEIPFFRTEREKEAALHRVVNTGPQIDYSLIPERLTTMTDSGYLERYYLVTYGDGSGLLWPRNFPGAARVTISSAAPANDEEGRLMTYVLSNPRISIDQDALQKFRTAISALRQDLPYAP